MFFKYLFLLILSCVVSDSFAQKEISICTPQRKAFSYLKFSANGKKVYKDSLVLMRRNKQTFSVEESEESKSVDSLLSQISQGKAVMSIYDKKGRLFERCGGCREFLTGNYERYRRNGKLKIKGQFNGAGGKYGRWLVYDRKGEIKKISMYKNSFQQE